MASASPGAPRSRSPRRISAYLLGPSVLQELPLSVHSLEWHREDQHALELAAIERILGVDGAMEPLRLPAPHQRLEGAGLCAEVRHLGERPVHLHAPEERHGGAGAQGVQHPARDVGHHLLGRDHRRTSEAGRLLAGAGAVEVDRIAQHRRVERAQHRRARGGGGGEVDDRRASEKRQRPVGVDPEDLPSHAPQTARARGRVKKSSPGKSSGPAEGGGARGRTGGGVTRRGSGASPALRTAARPRPTARTRSTR